jgi:hypothetical protein
MLIRESAPTLRPGAYLIGVAPEGARLSYQQLRIPLVRALTYIEGL